MTQNQRIIDYLQRNGSITTIQAISDLKITRLASRMVEIQAAGIPINKESIRVDTQEYGPTRVTRYSLGV